MLSLTTILVLGGEIIFVAVIALMLFRFRDVIGLGPLYVFVGTTQYLSVVLASSIYLHVLPGVYVSPGSVVLFTESLFVILLVYLKTDIPTVRGLIFGIITANVALTGLVAFTGLQMGVADQQNLLGLPVALFSVSPRVFFTGTALLFLDFVLVVILYQWMTVHLRWMRLFLRLAITLTVVLVVDAVMFTTLVFGAAENFLQMMQGQLLGKIPAGLLYAALLYGYLRLFEPVAELQSVGTVAGQVDDVFSLFTYRERYEEVRDKLAESEAANLAKSRFLANMSHELRTPLNAIIGFTSVLLKRNTQETEERLLLQRVQANGTHLLDLINGLLDLSKIEAGRAELKLVPVDVSALVSETVDQLQAQASQKGLLLVAEVPSGPLSLNTDRLRLKQVLINLIGNAVKFTPSGRVRVRLTASREADIPARVDIEDTGIGIEQEKLETIFSPFYHANYYGPDETSVGLGLAISRALCKEMGYRLEVDSTLGKGSNFSVNFVPE